MRSYQAMLRTVFGVVSALCAQWALAVDGPVSRTIEREPAYANRPEYALLVFGREAETRIWIVLDGRTLYVDRNANGDLTDDGPPVAAETGLPFSEAACEFNVGSLKQGALKHERVVVSVTPAAGARQPSVRKLVATAPKARTLAVTMMVQNDRLSGSLISKPYMQLTAGVDETGVLQLADRPADAPILHFNGPLRIQSAPWDWENKLTPGRKREFITVLATPGVGPGATVLSGYEGLLPAEAYPRVTCSLPALGAATATTSFDLKERCCTSQLYGELLAPAGTAPGTVEATLELVGWPTEIVASSKTSVPVTLPPALPDEAVSKRLRSTLPHTARTSVLYGVRFSPDGKRLLGNTLYAKQVDVWEVDTGRQLVTIDISGQSPTALLDAVPSPDWTVLYSNTRRRKGTPVERDGKAMIEWDVGGAIHEWDLSTGHRVQSTVVDPPGSVYSLSMSHDGSTLLFGSERPGLVPQSADNTELRLFDVATRQFRSLSGRYGMTAKFSPDGDRILAMLQKSAWHSNELHVLSRQTGEVLARLHFDGDQLALTDAHFSPDGRKVAAVSVTYSTPTEFRDATVSIFDAATGALIRRRQIEAGPSQSGFVWSPDGEHLAVTSWSGLASSDGRFDLLKAGDLSPILTRRLTNKNVVRECAFRKDGLLALATQVVPENKLDIDPTEMPQACIDIIDVRTGRSIDTLIAPRGALLTMEFSPDGQTLATGSTGAVHLWDVSDIK